MKTPVTMRTPSGARSIGNRKDKRMEGPEMIQWTLNR
jgi:hypothetical protein